MARSAAKPISVRDKRVSTRHLRETLAMNKKHAAEHGKLAKTTNKASAKYNRAHEKAHKKAAKEDLKLLKKRSGS